MGNARGVDGFAAEHFIYADERIHVILSILFNCFISHGYFPSEFMKTAIVPIIKNKTGDTSDRNNYRPIALVTACSKFWNYAFCPLLKITFVHTIISFVLRSIMRLICVAVGQLTRMAEPIPPSGQSSSYSLTTLSSSSSTDRRA